MAILDTSKKPLVNDRNTNDQFGDEVFIGIDLPFHKSNGKEGYFASTKFTIDAVKNNVKALLSTKKGELYFHPNLGVDLDNFLFEQITDELIINVQDSIANSLEFWMPFVKILDIKVSGVNSVDSDKNRLKIEVVFGLNSDPNTFESVTIDVGV